MAEARTEFKVIASMRPGGLREHVKAVPVVVVERSSKLRRRRSVMHGAPNVVSEEGPRWNK